jgi:hypothetical protein
LEGFRDHINAAAFAQKRLVGASHRDHLLVMSGVPQSITSPSRKPPPLHLDVEQKIAADPSFRSRLEGVLVDDFLMDLMGFEHLRPLLTRRFFKAYPHLDTDEEQLWWAAMHLDRALQTSSVKMTSIHSVELLLVEGKRAKEALEAAGMALVP